jgi:formylglycine-generating enzyme required for sulfatase activity
VRKLGDRVRVTAQLIDARNDEHLWAERFERRIEDAFALQDEVCEPIVAAVVARLGGAGTATATTAPVLSTVAAAATPIADAAATNGRGQRLANRLLRRGTLVGGALLLLALAGALTFTLQGRAQERWAREQALPELEALIASEDYEGAFALAPRIAKVIPNDPRLKALEPEFSASVTLRTDPSPATVHYRPYRSSESDWRLVGETPLENVPAPVGYGLWKFEAPGRATTIHAMRNPGAQLQSNRELPTLARFADVDLTIRLPAAAELPDGMVLVPATRLDIPRVSTSAVDLPAFYIDRLETINREYQAFVAAGGYGEAKFWQDLPFDPVRGDWRAQVGRFVDATGRPGPATWEAGNYPDGTAEEPVGGLSWFEAAAYARFRDKQLPTAYHWYRAANSLRETLESLATATVRRSNFSGKAVQAVGSASGIGPFGTQDMAGNVREWLWNDAGTGRWIAGGAWNQPEYMFNETDAADPYDRSATNGVRAMRMAQGGPIAAELLAAISPAVVDFAALQPSSDAVYAAIAGQYEYVPATAPPVVTAVASGNPAWTRERITLPTGYDATDFNVQLFLPSGGRPPYPVVVFGPHSGYRMGLQHSDDYDPVATSVPLDFVLKSGRALAIVAFDSTFERSWPAARRAATPLADRYRLLLAHWRQEIGRTLDYLATREDIAADRVGWYGVSYGAQTMLPLLALEPRIGAAVLDGGGIFPLGVPAAEEPFNYLPRTRQPVLMLSGRWDIDVPLESQLAMLRLLGAPDERKKHVLFEAGHGALPQRAVMRETLDWFDQYL